MGTPKERISPRGADTTHYRTTVLPTVTRQDALKAGAIDPDFVGTRRQPDRPRTIVVEDARQVVPLDRLPHIDELRTAAYVLDIDVD